MKWFAQSPTLWSWDPKWCQSLIQIQMPCCTVSIAFWLFSQTFNSCLPQGHLTCCSPCLRLLLPRVSHQAVTQMSPSQKGLCGHPIWDNRPPNELFHLSFFIPLCHSYLHHRHFNASLSWSGIVHVLIFLLIACPHTSSTRAGCGPCSAIPDSPARGLMPTTSRHMCCLSECINESPRLPLSLLLFVPPRWFLAGTPASLVEKIGRSDWVSPVFRFPV